MKMDLSELTDTSAMGTLQSGIDLGRKFSLKAVGGEDSLEKSLDSHIAAVREMRDFFQKCVDRYESVDAANSATFSATEMPR